jgi:hypothetical protein
LDIFFTILIIRFYIRIIGLELQGGLVFLEGLIVQAPFFIGDGQVVMGRDGVGIGLEGFFPSENGFIPKVFLRSPDAELDLVGDRGRGTTRQKDRQEDDQELDGNEFFIHPAGLP